MAGLLVSVRSAREALAALAGGATLIDVKEPARGSLGRAPDTAIRAVLKQVAPHCPVSAALGELLQQEPVYPGHGLSYVKWGLAGYGRGKPWQRDLTLAAAKLRESSTAPRPVAVAYADWKAACAPRPSDVCRFACENRWPAFLLDTWSKDGRTLVDCISPEEISRLCSTCRAAGVGVALAGALRASEIRRLRPSQADWFAVRTAACRASRREGVIETARVRLLAKILEEAPSRKAYSAI
jgi:(5-formylfuran-3-yl)methyl phosphate synthase